MSKNILHIDDEQPIRAIVADMLAIHGYRIRSVATLEEALAAVRAEAPDLIISDLQLQAADGLEILAQLHAIKQWTPVIVLTGVLMDPKVVRETVGALVSAYIEKTGPLSAVVAEVQRLIGPAD